MFIDFGNTFISKRNIMRGLAKAAAASDCLLDDPCPLILNTTQIGPHFMNRSNTKPWVVWGV